MTPRAIGGGRIHPVRLEVGFGAGDEKRTGLVQPIQTGEIDITAVHDIDRASLRHQHIERMHIVQLAIGNMDETRDVAAQIEQCVHLHRGLGRSEMRPWEQRQAQIDGGRVQRVNGFLQVRQQALAGIQPPRLGDQPLGELGINAPIAGLVRIRQRRPPDRSAKAHVLELRRLGRQARLDVTQAFPVGQLGECHGPVLLGARKCLHRVVAIITATIRANVLQGRQSISCENSVFPAFMGGSSPEKGRGNRRQLQIDTTQNRRKTLIGQTLQCSSFALLRTAVRSANSPHVPIRLSIPIVSPVRYRHAGYPRDQP